MMPNGEENKAPELPYVVAQLRLRVNELAGLPARVEHLEAGMIDLKATQEVSKRFIFGFWDSDTGKRVPGVSEQIADTRADIGAVKDIALGLREERARRDARGWEFWGKLLLAPILSGAIVGLIVVIATRAIGHP